MLMVIVCKLQHNARCVKLLTNEQMNIAKISAFRVEQYGIRIGDLLRQNINI